MYPTAAEYLRLHRMATKNAEITKRLVLARGEPLRSRLSLDQADSERLLRRILTRLDDDTRRISEEIGEARSSRKSDGEEDAVKKEGVDLLFDF